MNPYKAKQREEKEADLRAQCDALLKQGKRVDAVRLYRAKAGVSLQAAMKALNAFQP